MNRDFPLTRRQFLGRCATLAGSVSLVGYVVPTALPWAESTRLGARPPRARSVINLVMLGGPSQMDTFDRKPRLDRENGRALPFATPPTSNSIANVIMKSPFRFAQHGQSGRWVSELLPHIAGVADELTVVHSMCHTQSDHGLACCFTSTGHERSGRPSFGAWVLYGLGSRNRRLPGFVALNEGTPLDDNLSCGFLPPTFTATRFFDATRPVADLRPREADPRTQERTLELVRRLNRLETERAGPNPLAQSVAECRDQAVDMQSSVPELYDFRDETRRTLDAYGVADPITSSFATQCLIARRLIERGVRFVQINHKGWDQHANLPIDLRAQCDRTDKPVAALVRDLRARGLLDETLVMWGGEFGRTPNAQGTDGRDHNPFGYTIWLAGGGMRPGMAYGATDEYGYFAVENKVKIPDLHATVLHLLGIDHTKLTYRFGGRDYRLTDVDGELVEGILA